MKNLKIYNEFIKEQYNELDPYAEEKWEDDVIVGYFICDRHRAYLNDDYAKNFLKTDKPKIYTNFDNVRRDFVRGFYDDSYAGIYELYKSGNVKRVEGYGCN